MAQVVEHPLWPSSNPSPTKKKKKEKSRTRCSASVILTPKRWRQEDCEFEVSLGYRIRSCLKKTNKQKQKRGPEKSHVVVCVSM
jgi:hypothetical protein